MSFAFLDTALIMQRHEQTLTTNTHTSIS